MSGRRRPSPPTPCPSCGRTTQSVAGRCPHCGKYKPGEEPAWAYRPRWLRGTSIWDDLSLLALAAWYVLPGPVLIVLGVLWLGGAFVVIGALLLAATLAFRLASDWW